MYVFGHHYHQNYHHYYHNYHYNHYYNQWYFFFCHTRKTSIWRLEKGDQVARIGGGGRGYLIWTMHEKNVLFLMMSSLIGFHHSNSISYCILLSKWGFAYKQIHNDLLEYQPRCPWQYTLEKSTAQVWSKATGIWWTVQAYPEEEGEDHEEAGAQDGVHRLQVEEPGQLTTKPFSIKWREKVLKKGRKNRKIWGGVHFYKKSHIAMETFCSSLRPPPIL